MLQMEWTVKQAAVPTWFVSDTVGILNLEAHVYFLSTNHANAGHPKYLNNVY